MKNILKIIFLSGCAGLLLTTSCKKKLDEAYANPNAATRQPVETLLPSLIGSVIGSSAAAGSAYGIAGDALLIGRYIQYWGTLSTTFQALSQTASNQSNYDAMAGTVGSSDNLGSMWAAYYFGMGQNLNSMVAWATEEEKWDFVGAGWALRAWSMFETTNEYNHMIVRQAFDRNRQQFDYEDQPEIYDSVRLYCFRALAYLNRTDGSLGKSFVEADAYFNGGDVNRWKKFVYGILARSYAYLSNKTSYSADSVIKYADLAMTSNADNITCKFAATGISGTSNYFGPFRGNVGSLRQSQYIADLMYGLNAGAFSGVIDPRLPYLLQTDSSDGYHGIIPWKGYAAIGNTKFRPFNFWAHSDATSTAAPSGSNKGTYLFRDNAEFPIMTASEMQFLKAEAALRKGQNSVALAAYVNGISLNFDMLSSKYNTNVPAGLQITDAKKAAYLAATAIVPTDPAALTKTRIMLQKYIALYGWGVQETWADMRRYHYIDVDAATNAQVYVNFTPPSGSDLYSQNGGKLVYRCRMRYNSEYLYDIPSLQAIGALDGAGAQVPDYHTKECWFSKP